MEFYIKNSLVCAILVAGVLFGPEVVLAQSRRVGRRIGGAREDAQTTDTARTKERSADDSTQIGERTPQLAVTLNDQDGEVEVFAGWALILDACLLPPTSASPKSSSRREVVEGMDAVRTFEIQIVGPDGGRAEWQFRRVQPMENSPTDGGTDTRAGAADNPRIERWLLSTEASSSLFPGRYQLIVAALPTDNASGETPETIHKAALNVVVRPEPESLTDEQSTEKLLFQAREAHIDGRPRDAHGLADKFMKSGGSKQIGFALVGEALASEKRFVEAIGAYDLAIQAALDADSSRIDPPQFLIGRRIELEQLLRPAPGDMR